MDEQQPQKVRINPGQHQNFVYVGNLIPNQVFVQNLGTAEARFRLTSTGTPPGWDYYGEVAGSALRYFLVHFPIAKLTVYNVGTTPIEVSGEYLRPT